MIDFCTSARDLPASYVRWLYYSTTAPLCKTWRGHQSRNRRLKNLHQREAEEVFALAVNQWNHLVHKIQNNGVLCVDRVVTIFFSIREVLQDFLSKGDRQWMYNMRRNSVSAVAVFGHDSFFQREDPKKALRQLIVLPPYKNTHHHGIQKRKSLPFSTEVLRRASEPSFFLYRASPQFTSCPSNIPTCTTVTRAKHGKIYFFLYCHEM